MPSDAQDRLHPRVVHVTSAHSARDARIFYKECRSLARAGYEVIELTNAPADAAPEGIRIRGLGRSRSRLHRVTTKMLVMAREAFRLNADVYHIHDPELLPLALLLRARGRRVVYDIHEDLPRTILYKHYIPAPMRVPLMRLIEAMEGTAARVMSGLVTATPAIANRFRSLNPKSVVVNNFPIPAELARGEALQWSQRSMSVAYIGGISPERGLGELLAAMDRQPAINAKLDLAGWFSDPGFQQELMQSPAWGRVTWHGLLNRTGVAELLTSVRAGLVVLRPERNFMVSQPVKLFEYMAAGLPVIASDFPGWRDIIVGAGCGILVDPCKPASIADAISYLLTHDAEAEAMGKRGRAAVERQYNWHMEERNLLGFYADLFNLGRDRV